MSFFLKFLVLILSITTIATPVPFQDNLRNITNSSLPIMAEKHRGNNTGDTLGITRCYCASKHWETDNLFGYYYLWDYYNFHSNSRVLLERVCHHWGWTRSGILMSQYYQLYCLRAKNGERECMNDVNGNQFCYYLYGKEKFDKFTWNHQRRGIPLDSPVATHASEAEVVDKCEALCHDKVGDGDMEMLKGRSLVYADQKTPDQDRFRAVDNEWSHISYYPEIDDMCHGCKK